MKYIHLLTFMIIACFGHSQESDFYSIHREDNEQFKAFGMMTPDEYDAFNGFGGAILKNDHSGKGLFKRVFGYFPYWAGSNYLNYQWNLLSDLCYFSYEVDPASGNPVTIHEWNTSPAIDTALAKGVKVHLCVTLFSGHSAFFSSPAAQQTLISNIISLIQSRGAHGVNMDVEALPSSWGNAFTDFMISLTNQVHDIIPGAEVSIAAPAVNWSGTFNISLLSQHIDFFMVMGYDYYWNGSSQAGPVSPLYTMVGSYDYNFTKTVSYYQSQGVPLQKLVMGVPYYARQWPTQGQYAPSATTGSGTAYTYRFVKINSSGNYSPANRHIEPNSLSTYYSFNNGNWNQCFLDEVYSLGKKYDLVNRRNLAGIGIWALGYDDGFSDLWNLIADKFSDWQTLVEADTLYDSGGPTFNYYNNENYLYTLKVPDDQIISLNFEYIDLEPGYDSLWIFDGIDASYPLLGSYSGNDSPGVILSSSNHLTLKFYSDVGITAQGWKAYYHCVPLSAISKKKRNQSGDEITVFPNPAKRAIHIKLGLLKDESAEISVYDVYGRLMPAGSYIIHHSGNGVAMVEFNGFKSGPYLLMIKSDHLCKSTPFMIR